MSEQLTEAEARERWPDLNLMTAEAALERWPDLDDEQRERKRQHSVRGAIQAKLNHEIVADPESGRRAFGGPQPGAGRKRRLRVSEHIVELAETTKSRAIANAIFSGLDEHNDPKVRVRTAEVIAKMGMREAELKMAEDEFEGKPREQLLKLIAPALARMSAKGELPELVKLLGLNGGNGGQPQIESATSDVDGTARTID